MPTDRTPVHAYSNEDPTLTRCGASVAAITFATRDDAGATCSDCIWVIADEERQEERRKIQGA